MSIPKILILCTGNSARSQIAEGLIRNTTGDKTEVFSAGTEPRPLNPIAVDVMKEIGIDISHHRSKDIAELFRLPFDWVITVCDSAKEKCPIFPGARVTHWDIPDPQTSEDFRKVRDDLSSRIHAFLEELNQPVGA